MGPPGMPPPTKRGSSGMLALLGVLVLMVVGAGAYFLVFSGDDDDDAPGASGASPTEAVEALFAAARDSDCEAAVDVTTFNFWGGVSTREEALAACQEGLAAAAAVLTDEPPESLDELSVESDRATVEVTYNGADGPSTSNFELVKDDQGNWKIDGFSVGGDFTEPVDPTDTTSPDDPDEDPDDPPDDEAGPPEPPPSGSPGLDDLADACYAGSMSACDDLYAQAEVGSDYEEYGATCGGRLDTDLYCEEAVPNPELP